jgi:release factor glutamine methyltransferase
MATELNALDRAELLTRATARLIGGGVVEPRREACRLWRDVLTPLGGFPADAVGVGAAARYLEAVERRRAGEPLAYVTGWTGFRHLVLATDRRALIPRPETERLVELALARVRTGVAADIGTGTGAIALSLAHEGDFTRVIGTDIAEDALTLARENGVRTGLAVSWRVGDLVAPLAGEAVDLVVSNPPYLTRAEVREVDPSVGEWEPHRALDGGEDGLEPYRRLFAEAPSVLRAGGWLALEVDVRRATATAELATIGWRNVTIHDDLFGCARYVLAQREE